MIGRKSFAVVLACVMLAVPALSQKAPPVAPASVVPAVPAERRVATERSASAPTPGAVPLTASDVGAWLDGFMPSALEAGKIAGAQVVVVKDGQLLFKKGYGYADVAAKRPMDVDRTLMRIGSTSKLFTWTAVMQLVEAGKIDLNADINKYLDIKITPKAGRAITMNDLMRHRGGFEEGLKDLIAIDPARFKSNEQYLKENVRPMMFAAGEVPAYSNYGTALAGYIVQRVSGEPFDAYIERHIFAPLRMGRATFRQPVPPALRGSLSQGYMRSDQPPGPFEFATTSPAGSVSATGADMAHFMIAHLQNGRFGDQQILRPETAQLMHRPAVQPEPGFDTMAHGFFQGRQNGRLIIGHGGDTIVFHTDLTLLPEEGVGIFVSFNSRGENDAAYGARERLKNLFLDRYFPGRAAPTPPAIAGAADHAAAIAGGYEGSRRVENGFIGIFYLLQQDGVAANPDGTISLASIPAKSFREIAPGLWQEVDGTRRLRVGPVAGRLSIIDSANPISILQAVPAARSSKINTLVAGLSFVVLLLTVIGWPIAWWLRRKYKAPALVTGRAALVQRLTRGAALADVLYLIGWYTVLAPVLQMRYYEYNAGMDGLVRTLQIASIVPIVGAVIGIYNAFLAFTHYRGWAVATRSVIVAAALIGIVWVAWMGQLIGFELNY
ncbi:serine hydrolase domain-containing protein [Sphingomonas sp. PB4P5]|uniref:serine hydrolase domain-containing protein n=1 Tax=Parasphingomonas puruogangriensis TaxID=3096155 RepID=UPI002FC86A44